MRRLGDNLVAVAEHELHHECMMESSLNANHEWTGQWWLPENPTNKVSGVLTFSPEAGLKLRLIGGWDYNVTVPGKNGSTIVTDELQSWPVVLGIGDGKLVSLLGVNVSSAKGFGVSAWFGPPDRLDLRAHAALVGVHVDAFDEPAFVAASADVDDLTVWSRRSGIEQEIRFPSSSEEVAGEIKLSQLEPLSAEAGPLTVTLHHYSWRPFSEPTRSQNLSRVRESQVIRLEREEPQHFEYWLDLLSSTADLISLSTLRPCGLISVRLFLPPAPDDWPEDHPLRDQPHEVSVYMHRLVEPRPDDKALDLRSYVLTLDDLPFEQLMPRWLEVRDKFAAARSMILGLRYVRAGYIETRVVTAVAAAESMHRALDPAPPIPPADFKKLRKVLMEAVPPEWKSWLSDKITTHANVPSLNQRLIELVERVGDAGKRLVHEPDTWAKAAKDARNNLAHVGTAQNDLEHLRAVADVTASVVILNLLHELGVPQDRLLRAINEHPELSRAAKLARRVLCNDQSVVVQMAALNVTVVDDDTEVVDRADQDRGDPVAGTDES
jgi:hypothetical protein